MDGDEVRLVKELLNLDELQPAREMRIRIDIWIVGDHIHPDGLALPGHLTADAAKADHAQCLPCQLDAFEFGLFPLAVLQGFISLRNIPGEGE